MVEPVYWRTVVKIDDGDFFSRRGVAAHVVNHRTNERIPFELFSMSFLIKATRAKNYVYHGSQKNKCVFL